MTALLNGCYEDFDNSNPDEIIPEKPDVIVEGELVGQIESQNELIITDYDVELNGVLFNVEEENFLIKEQGLNKRNQAIFIVKDNKEIGLACKPVIENNVNKLSIKTFPGWKNETISEGENVVSISDQVELNFGSNIFNTSSPNMEINYGEFSSQELLIQTGVYAKGEFGNDLFIEGGLGFYFEFFENNTQVSINPNQQISLHYDLSNVDINGNIGLFHFDRIQNQWLWIKNIDKNSTQTTVQSDGYFRFAEYSDAVFLEGSLLVDQTNVSFTKLELMSDNEPFIRVYTTDLGRWGTYIPINTDVDVNVGHLCDDTNEIDLTEGETEDVEGKIISLDQQEHTLTKLDFVLIDCDGSEVQNPEFLINDDGKETLLKFSQTNINTWLQVCADNFIISDKDGNVELPWSIDEEDEIGYLSICSDHQNGFGIIEIRDDSKIFKDFTIDYQDGLTNVSELTEAVNIVFKGNDTRAYADDEVNIYLNDATFGTDGYMINCLTSDVGCGLMNFNVTHTKDTNEENITRFSFEGEVWMQTLDNPVAGRFPIKGLIISKQ